MHKYLSNIFVCMTGVRQCLWNYIFLWDFLTWIITERSLVLVDFPSIQQLRVYCLIRLMRLLCAGETVSIRNVCVKWVLLCFELDLHQHAIMTSMISLHSFCSSFSIHHCINFLHKISRGFFISFLPFFCSFARLVSFVVGCIIHIIY